MASELRVVGGRWSKSKLSRIESAQLVPSVRDTGDMLALYGVADGPEREALIDLARDHHKRGWWAEFRDQWTGGWVAFEAEASHIRTFEPVLIPSLLQTLDYARAVIQASADAGVVDPAEVGRRAEARIARQRIFERAKPPRLSAVLDDSVLTRLVGGAKVMAAQLDHLLHAAQRPNITIQVFPSSLGAHPGMDGAFTHLDFPDPTDTPVVQQQTNAGGVVVEGQTVVEAHLLRIDYLRARALGPPESLEHIRRVRDQLDAPNHTPRMLGPGSDDMGSIDR